MTVAEFVNKVGFKVNENDVNKVNGAINNIKSTAAKLVGAIGITLTIKGIYEGIKSCVSLSSEVEEMENKFNVVFTGMEDTVDKWAQNYADAIGRNKNDIKTYLADQQNLLVGFGMTREEGAKLSEEMTSLALDLASFSNIDEATAVNAMSKAVMGESEAAKTIGAVLNDATRQQAMYALGLDGTYESLSQLQKMQVNYQAILQQNPDAVGDCERSLGSYQSALKQFTSKLKELKTMVGQFFIPVFQKTLAFGSKAVMRLRDAMTKVQEFADRCGGVENVLRLVAVAASAVFAAFKLSKIKKAVQDIKKMDKALIATKLKMLSIIAVIVLIALLADDFINFMKGNGSIIGTVLEKAGVDVDKFRANVVKIWESIKTALPAIWQGIKNVAIPIFQSIWSIIKTVFERIGDILGAIIPKFADLISQLANGKVDTAKWVKVGEAIGKIAAIIVGVVLAVRTAIGVIKSVTAVVRGVGAAVSFLTSPVGLVVLAIAALIAIIVLCVKHWDDIKAAAGAAWDFICGVWGSVADWFNTNVVQPIIGFFTGLWDGIVSIVAGIKDSVVEGLTAAIDWITSLPAQALQWGADIIQGIVDGIKGAIGKVGEAVSGVADKIKSFLGFSEPDEGPLSDFHTYMPDMVDLMSKGIKGGKDKVKSALEGLTGDMSVMAKASLVRPETMRSITSNSGNRSVNMTNNFNQQFNGDRAAQQKSAAAMEKATGDISGELARALAYAK